MVICSHHSRLHYATDTLTAYESLTTPLASLHLLSSHTQTYLALALLKRHEKEWNLDIHLEPVSIGYLFQAAGNKAPLTVPNKGKMMVRSYSVAC